MKTYGEMEVYLQGFSTMEVRDKFHDPAALPLGKSPGALWTEGWVNSIFSLDVVAKRKDLTPTGNRSPVIQPVASPLQ
jgi:hypothetical protein